MRIEPFRVRHIAELKVQDAQAARYLMMTEDQYKAMESVPSFTAFEGGEVLGCGGILEYHPERALIWSYVSANAGRHFLKVHRAVSQFLDTTTYKRLEAEVAVDFENGHRWVRMLGFEVETPRARNHMPEGGDATIYVRIR